MRELDRVSAYFKDRFCIEPIETWKIPEGVSSVGIAIVLGEPGLDRRILESAWGVLCNSVAGAKMSVFRPMWTLERLPGAGVCVSVCTESDPVKIWEATASQKAPADAG